MKRSLVLIGALSLAALLLYIPSGNAQTTGPTIVRAIPLQVTISTTPRRDRSRPFTFVTTGRIRPPAGYCAPGVDPVPGAGNCVPVICPPGITDIRYCFIPGRGVICSGTVTVRYQKRTTTVSARNVQVRPDCTYRSRVTFKLLLPTRKGVLNVRARFNGNAVLQPKISRTTRVRAG